MAIKGILFDKDGTLLDFHETWMPSIRALVGFLGDGRPELEDRLLETGGFDKATGRVLSGSILAAGHPGDLAEAWIDLLPEHARDLGKVTTIIEAFFEQNVEPKPVCDLSAFADALLAQGMVLGIATNDSAAGIETSLKGTGFIEKVAFKAGYDSGHGGKPGPGMGLAFCAATGLDPSEVMMVGDNSHDMEMGRAAGCGMLVGVLTGNSSRDDLTPMADHVLDTIEELPALVAAGA